MLGNFCEFLKGNNEIIASKGIHVKVVREELLRCSQLTFKWFSHVYIHSRKRNRTTMAKC